MSSMGSFTMENFLTNWKAVFPDYHLDVEELKNPLSLMGAVFQLFNRLGIDGDAVLMPPTEKNINDNAAYYWDLIPVINMTRVINRLVSGLPKISKISINHFLQPKAASSHSILLLLFNLMLFNEGQLQGIAPYEEELFDVAKSVKDLENKKNTMLEMLNLQVEEKAKRAQRVEQMEIEIKQFEQDIQAEEHARDLEKQELEVLIKENNATDLLLDQKRATKEGLLAERERKRALRVYDAEDIMAQAAQAAQNVQEAEEKLNSLQSIIAQKENSLKILHMIKPSLDTANNLLHEITKLKDSESGTLDEESKEGELQVLATELSEARAAAAALAARRRAFATKQQNQQALREQERGRAESAMREAEEKDKKRRDFAARAALRTEEIKEQTATYAERKARGYQCIQEIKESYDKTITNWEEALCKLVADLKKDIEKKQHSLDM